jgi:hypothetical protein
MMFEELTQRTTENHRGPQSYKDLFYLWISVSLCVTLC